MAYKQALEIMRALELGPYDKELYINKFIELFRDSERKVKAEYPEFSLSVQTLWVFLTVCKYKSFREFLFKERKKCRELEV